jgi:hypothetical protein
MFKRLPVLFILVFISAQTMAQQWVSQNTKTDVIELYTSEGCSSCPPADRWLANLKQHHGLFKSFVPMAFHVDYWDWLGWQDRFADPVYSKRQRQYVREGAVSQVYTPGLVVNSEEWRAWFRGSRHWNSSEESAGILSATSTDKKLSIRYSRTGQPYHVNVAYLGMGITSSVKAGENQGKQLLHDFVVLKLVSSDGPGVWELDLPELPDVGQQRSAIAIWVTPVNSQKILQAVGGFL